jgi:LPXTG-motif cell wall-anchored protein
VEKNWDDGPEIHTSDAVYLLLLKDGIPVLDNEGYARLLRLDASNNWQGVFTVVLADKDDSVTNYDYAVREVTQVSIEPLYTWSSAVLENDGTTLLYYERALEDGQLGAFGGRSYVVRYEKTEDDSWIVTNLHAVELPKTGGMGTAPIYTFGGLLTTAAAFVAGYDRRRKQRREAVE